MRVITVSNLKANGSTFDTKHHHHQPLQYLMQKTPKSLRIHHTVLENSNNDTGLEMRPGIFRFILVPF